MSEFLDHLRGPGELECRGEFSLDLEQAKRKMSRFQLRHPHDFLHHLVGGLFRLGARRLEVFCEGAQLRLEMPPLLLPDRLLEDLAGAIFEEKSGVRRLAAAAQSLLAFELVRFDWLGTLKEQCFDYRTGQGRKWDQVSLHQIQIEGLPRPIVDKALAELAHRGAWTRRPLRVGERRFQLPQGLEVKLGGFSAECEWRPEEKPQLVLIMDEIAAEFRSIDAPFAWTGICYGEFRLDASLAQVVEDESLERILQDIPKTYTETVRLGLAGLAPESVLPLLSNPLPDWLEPLKNQLLDMPLFADQRRRFWSLSELLRGTDPLYLAHDAKDFRQLDVTVLVKPSSHAVECLKAYLGPRLQRANELVLRQLQRQHNQRLWQNLPRQSLALSQRHWLCQQEFQHNGARWLVGIADDWSQSGASVTLSVDGRRLAVSRLLLQEISCEIACEVPADQVNELWTGLDGRAWSELERRWNESIQQLLETFAGGQEARAEVRHHLKKQLAACAVPEHSYFCKTLLFEDWKGRLYSLDQLLHLESGLLLGVVGPQYQPDHFTSPLIPDGVYLRDSGLELTILHKMRLPGLVILDYLLEDWLQAQRQAFEERSLQPKPGFGAGTVHFCVAGVCLAPLRCDSPIAFEARWSTDQLDVETDPSNHALGAERFRPVQNERTQKALAEVGANLLGELRKQFPENPEESWLEWLRQATLRKLCRDFLVEVACWPCYPQGRVSLKQLNQAAAVYWCSGEVAPVAAQALQGQILLTSLTHRMQAELRAASDNQQWICLDEQFAREHEHIEFLRKPLWQADFSDLVAHQAPDLWLLATGAGRVYWLYQGRLVEEEVGLVPYGFRLAVECPSLRPEDRPGADRSETCYAFLREWLTAPQRPLWGLWGQWTMQDFPRPVVELLESQKWFSTTRGTKSWQQLMEEPEIWFYSGPPRAFPEELLLVFDRPDLLDKHRNAHSVRDTELKLAALDGLEAQRQHALLLSRRLEKLPYRTQSDHGELALSGDNTKNVWLLDGEREVLVDNLPAGLVGYLQCQARIRVQRNERPAAELNGPDRDACLEKVAELLKARVAAGPLKRAEVELICEVCQAGVDLETLRWIECADGSYASLQQLRQESEERGRLLYWPRNYFFKAGGPALLPILSTPLMLDLVARACHCSPQLCPAPLLHRDLTLPSLSDFRQALSALAQVVSRGRNLPLLAGMRTVLAGQAAPEEPEVGRALLLALQRRASQLLSGTARKVCLHHLETAELRPGLERLWEFQGKLLLRRDHPLLREWLADQEPPLAVQTSLLLSLVCAVNAMSLPFTDEMELEFLENLSQEILASLPRSATFTDRQTLAATP